MHSKNLVHIANIDNVINISVNVAFPKALLISENGKKLLQCDLRHLQSRSKANVCLNTGLDYIELDLPFVKENINDSWRFVTIYNNTECGQEISEPIAIAAAKTQIVILRYSIEQKFFKAICSLDTATPVQSVYFTPHTAIVSSDKFFEINLKTLTPNEFLDLSDPSLLHTVSSEPFDTFAVNQQEYLMCFKEFGVFVNRSGYRTRPNDIKWLDDESPIAFTYRAPILYIFYDNGVQIMRIHKSFTNELDDEQTDEKYLRHFMNENHFINANDVRFGTNYGKYGVYMFTSITPKPTNRRSGNQQIVRIDGTKALRNTLTDSMETILSSETDY